MVREQMREQEGDAGPDSYDGLLDPVFNVEPSEVDPQGAAPGAGVAPR